METWPDSEVEPTRVVCIDISQLVFLTPLDIEDKVWRELEEVHRDFPDMITVFTV